VGGRERKRKNQYKENRLGFRGGGQNCPVPGVNVIERKRAGPPQPMRGLRKQRNSPRAPSAKRQASSSFNRRCSPDTKENKGDGEYREAEKKEM